MPKTKSQNKRFLNLVTNLVKLEEKGYTSAKEVVKKRNKLKREVEGLLEKKAALPVTGDFFAGLKKTKGRVSWKPAYKELVKRYNVPEAEDLEIQEATRKPGQKAEYGRRTNNPQYHQLEMDYLTPQP